VSTPRTTCSTALRIATALALAAALACGDPSGAESGKQGIVRAVLISPNGTEGAALFEMPIEGIVSVRAPVGTLIESQSGGRRQVALFVSQPGQLVLELTVADPRNPPEVAVRQVSGPSDQARSLTGYRVQVEVPE
jgi:hypothetical protein